MKKKCIVDKTAIDTQVQEGCAATKIRWEKGNADVGIQKSMIVSMIGHLTLQSCKIILEWSPQIHHGQKDGMRILEANAVILAPWPSQQLVKQVKHSCYFIQESEEFCSCHFLYQTCKKVSWEYAFEPNIAHKGRFWVLLLTSCAGEGPKLESYILENSETWVGVEIYEKA